MEWKIYLGKLLGRKRITAHVVLQDRNKFLLVQEAVSGIRGLWGLPGGGVDRGESTERAAERETEEETGYDIKIVRKLMAFDDKARGNIRHIFLGKIKGGQLKIDESEHMDAKWMTIEEITNLRDKLRGDWVLEAISLV